MADEDSAVEAERDGEWGRALEIYEGLRKVAADPAEKLRLHMRIAWCHFEDSAFDEAEDVLAKAGRLSEDATNNETLGSVRLLQGLIELERGHHRRALNRLAVARELLGDTPRVMISLATAMRERGELNEALALLNDLGVRGLDSRELADQLDELGAVHLERGDYASAEITLRSALELDDRISSEYQTARSKLLLSQAVLGLGRRKEARQLIDDAIESYEDSERGLSEAYTCLGQWYEDGGNYEGASKQYRKARDVDRDSDDVIGQARSCRNLARMFRLRGYKSRAEDSIEEARHLLAGLDDDLELAALYMEEGHLLIDAVDYDQAIERFNKALNSVAGDKEERAIAVAKHGLAIAYWKDGKLGKAEDLLNEALPILEARGDLRELDDLLDDLGEVLIDRNEYERALEALERSLDLDERLQAVASKARTLLLMGRAHLRLGDRRLAGERLQQALEAYKERDLENQEDDPGKADALCQYGYWLSEEGRFDDAMDMFKHALRIDVRQEDAVGVARAHRCIAGIYRRRGERERAAESLTSAQSELHSDGDPLESGLLLLEFARLAIDNGQWHEAESYVHSARRQFEETESPVQLAVTKRLLAGVYSSDPRSRNRALDLLLEAEEVLSRMRDFPELDDLYDDLGTLYLSLRRYDEALSAINRSLEIGKGMGWDRGNGRSYLIMARIHIAKGEMKDAKQALVNGIECFEKVVDDVGRSESQLLLGDWFVASGRLDDAVVAYKEARRIDRWHGDVRGMAKALRKLGVVYLMKGELGRAEDALDQSEDFMKGKHFVEEQGHLSLARGCLFAAKGAHGQAIESFQDALRDFDSLMMEEERVRAYKEMASSHHALGHFAAAMECMRKMGLEQAQIWGSLIDNFDEEFRSVVQAPYLRGEFATAITSAYGRVESALRERTIDSPQVEARTAVSDLISAWYTTEARTAGSLDPKNLVQLKNLATASFNLFRNPAAHADLMMNGVDAFVAISIAQYLYTHLDA